MATWRLKGCPRCNGDMFTDRDIDGWYEHCLLCGYTRDLPGAPIRAQTIQNQAKRPPEQTDDRRYSGLGIS